MLRQCRVCKCIANTQEDLLLFKTCTNMKYGKDTICKKCGAEQTRLIAQRNPKRQVEVTKQRVRANKIKAVNYLGGECAACGIKYDGTNAVIFDFHHLIPADKEMHPTKALRLSWDNLIKEISKCALLCSNCHRLEHKQEDW